MRMIRFTKAEGAQNDFLIVDDREQRLDEETRRRFARDACHRRRGAGSDGVIIIEPSECCDFRMVFHNPDGSTGAMCGNGGRTAALYAQRCGIAGERMCFEVLDRRYDAELVDGGVRLYFPPPTALRLDFTLPDVAGVSRLHYADTGAPHLVVFAGDLVPPAGLSGLPLEALAVPLRRHAAFAPEGTNVNVIAVRDGIVHVRTFEKGVEAETESCGTGSIASAIVAHVIAGLAPPLRIRAHGGDALLVGFTPPAAAALQQRGELDAALFGDGLYLEGPARLVFEGDWRMEDA